MSVPLSNYTLSYNGSSQGWVSFYSFEPEAIQGMNQYLYTFNGGNLYRHNVNDDRNTFYGDAASPSTITTVFNQDSLTTKVFKTIDLESQDAWKVTLSSDIQNGRDVEADWFEKKEGDWFAFIRGLSADTDGFNFNMKSTKGIGVPNTIVGTTPSQTLTFNFAITTPIQVGDSVFSTDDPSVTTPTLAGSITSITNPTPTTTEVVVNTGGNTAVSGGEFVFYVRNQVAESQGLLGHYCVMTLENNLTTATELMAVKVDLMKSYP
jgi:hypothetical protein